jgi:cyclopropane fatty-acyl-phospholipid synthase-like methyltransferase
MSNSYDYIADQWHANSRGQNYVDRVLGYVDRILEGLPRGSKVLDLGCGTGNPIARHVVQRGFQLVGVDQSKKMLEIAQREVPQGEFIHADMLEVEFHDEFAAIVAWDSAFHLERKHHAALYRRLANSLAAGGRLLLSVGGTTSEDTTSDYSSDEGFTSEMFGQTFFYSGFAPKVARELLEEAGFEIELWEIDDPSSRGHIAVIARKSS